MWQSHTLSGSCQMVAEERNKTRLNVPAAAYWSLRRDRGFDWYCASADNSTFSLHSESTDVDENGDTFVIIESSSSYDRDSTPGPIRALLKKDEGFKIWSRFRFYAYLFDEDHKAKFESRPSFLTDKLMISGDVWCEKLDGDTACCLHTRHAVSCKVFGIGGLVETTILSQVKGSYKSLSAMTEGYMATQAYAAFLARSKHDGAGTPLTAPDVSPGALASPSAPAAAEEGQSNEGLTVTAEIEILDPDSDAPAGGEEGLIGTGTPSRTPPAKPSKADYGAADFVVDDDIPEAYVAAAAIKLGSLSVCWCQRLFRSHHRAYLPDAPCSLAARPVPPRPALCSPVLRSNSALCSEPGWMYDPAAGGFIRLPEPGWRYDSAAGGYVKLEEEEEGELSPPHLGSSGNSPNVRGSAVISTLGLVVDQLRSTLSEGDNMIDASDNMIASVLEGTRGALEGTRDAHRDMIASALEGTRDALKETRDAIILEGTRGAMEAQAREDGAPSAASSSGALSSLGVTPRSRSSSTSSLSAFGLAQPSKMAGWLRKAGEFNTEPRRANAGLDPSARSGGAEWWRHHFWVTCTRTRTRAHTHTHTRTRACEFGCSCCFACFPLLALAHPKLLARFEILLVPQAAGSPSSLGSWYGMPSRHRTGSATPQLPVPSSRSASGHMGESLSSAQGRRSSRRRAQPTGWALPRSRRSLRLARRRRGRASPTVARRKARGASELRALRWLLARLRPSIPPPRHGRPRARGSGSLRFWQGAVRSSKREARC